MANRNYASAGKLYSMHVMPVSIDCNFVVDNTNPVGITSLKGPTVASVKMNSAAPSGLNPVAGTILIQLQDNYNALYSMDSSIISPLTGTPILIDNSALVPGTAYTITVLGDATPAKWLSIGVPAGITPAVGVSFIASSNGGAANVSTSRVQASASSGVASIELVNPSATLSPNRLAQPATGAQFILQCRDYAGAIVAPAAGSIISIKLLLSNSSISD